MKKIIMALMLVSVSIFANNDVRIFNNGETQTGGLVGGAVVFTYPNNKMIKITDLNSLQLIKEKLVNSICKEADMKELVNKGKKIVFLYPGDKKTSIFVIDTCK